MSSIRLCTPLDVNVPDYLPSAAGKRGDGSRKFDLTTKDGYAEFDVVIAAMERITSWDISGHVTTTSSYFGPPYTATCNYTSSANGTKTASGTGYPLLNNEADFASIDRSEVDSFPPFSIYIEVTGSGGGVGLSIPGNGGGRFHIAYDSENRRTIGYVKIAFEANDNDSAHGLNVVQQVRNFYPLFVPENYTKVGQVTFRVPRWQDKKAAFNQFDMDLFSESRSYLGYAINTDASFLVTAKRSHSYGGVWNDTSAFPILHPITEQPI